MVKCLTKFISRFEIDLRDKNKNEEFYKSLKGLITILFAIVFGVGLSELGKVRLVDLKTPDFWILIVAYMAVMLSWQGYHFGTVAGPRETNWWNYFVDVLLLVTYYFLIYKREPFINVLFCYLAMFWLYWIWEIIRLSKEDTTQSSKAKIRNASKINLKCFCFILILLILYISCYWLIKPYVKEWPYIIVLFILVPTYRHWVRKAYLFEPRQPIICKDDLEKLLVEKAKAVAVNARTHLSGFPVGAAILSDTGNIYTGCNVEFDNYSNTIHAEEAAISAFVVAGEKRPLSIAVFTFDDSIHFPCGMCLQSLFELGGKDLKVIACNNRSYETKTIWELLPFGFHL